MIDGKEVLAIVPARGGSKGFPGKNLAMFDGHSLIAHAVMRARDSTYIDRVIVSTDDNALADEGRRAGADVPFMRPAEFASDTAAMHDVAKHALETLKFTDGYLVLLQPTSPLRTTQDIDACLEACSQAEAPACVTVQEVDKTPYWMYRRADGGALTPFMSDGVRITARQDAPKAYLLNGAVYVADIAQFLKAPDFHPPGTISCIMPDDRSIDIDLASDLEDAKRIAANHAKSS